MTVVWTPRAARDLADIVAFVARDKPGAARRVGEKIFAAAQGLTTMPQRGRARFGTELRELVLSPLPYILRYSIEGEDVLITAVRHGAMEDTSDQP